MQAIRDAVTQWTVQSAPFPPRLLMSIDTRILNISRNTRLKPHQAERRIAEGLAIWVTPGETLRDASLKEVIEYRARMERAEATRHLEPSEVHGIEFVPPANATQAYSGLLPRTKWYAMFDAPCGPPVRELAPESWLRNG